MGYGIMPYAVSVEVLSSPHEYTGDPEDFLAWLQELYCSDDAEAGPTPQVMRELFYAEPYTGTEGRVYGHALESLCKRFGGLLGNDHWYPCGDRHLAAVRETLSGLGVDLDPRDLIWSGPPVPLPEIEDRPVIGHLRRDEMGPIAAALDAADLSAVTDRSVAGAITELHGWLRRCLEDDGRFPCDLVCFYY
ncbi:DUF7691 family protein [Actinomadura sediminis]|uniref:DUF7691 domain-containing protein n=1 Tax=Actinomadura sediminis TaxID=1038904 RepID=A0ABW3EHX2_9ACTN